MKTNSKSQSWSVNLAALLAIAALSLPGTLLADDTSAGLESTNPASNTQTRSLDAKWKPERQLERQEIKNRVRAESKEQKAASPGDMGRDKPLRESPEQNKAQSGQKAFCQRLDSEKSKLLGLVNEHKDKLLENRDQRVEALKDRVEKRGERIDNRRQAFDDRREAQFKKLEDRTRTDAQKQAVTAFRSALETSVEARRGAIDAARLTYQQGLRALIGTRNVSLKTAMETLRSQTETAFNQAKTDCAANVEPKTVRDNLKAGVKAAREQFQSQRQDLKSYQSQIKTLQDTREGAFKKAVSNFEIAIKQAKDALKTALQS